MLAGSDEAGSLHMMDAVWSLLITLSADGFVCSSLPLLAGGWGVGRRRGLGSSMETLRCRGLIAELRRVM